MSSLFWLVTFVVLLFISWFIYLILSTCLGPPLVVLLRSFLSTHYRSTKSSEWDSGGGGYREPYGGSSSSRGGSSRKVEMFEMGDLGGIGTGAGDDDY